MEDKERFVKIINKSNVLLPVSLGLLKHTRRGMTAIRTICGCLLLVNTEYLIERITDRTGIRHDHFVRKSL